MSNLLSIFIPKNNNFFQLFNQSTTNALQMSELLYKAVSAGSAHDEQMQFRMISRLKEKGHELKRQVYLTASKSLISPFDRSDMYALSTAINNVCKSIDGSARRINLYKIKMLEPSVKELSGLIVETITELDDSVKTLNDLTQAEKIVDCCKKIKAVERYANQVYHKALAAIITETDPISFIKYTDILMALERTTDKCAGSTAVIESILIKNAY